MDVDRHPPIGACRRELQTRRDPHVREAAHPVELGDRRRHGGDAGIHERLAHLQLQQGCELCARHRRNPVEGDRTEHVQRPPRDGEGDLQHAIGATTGSRRRSRAKALEAEVLLDVAAAVLDHFLVHRQQALNRHERTAPVVGQRVAGKRHLHAVAALTTDGHVDHAVHGIAHSSRHDPLVVAVLAQIVLGGAHAFLEGRPVERPAVLDAEPLQQIRAAGGAVHRRPPDPHLRARRDGEHRRDLTEPAVGCRA